MSSPDTSQTTLAKHGRLTGKRRFALIVSAVVWLAVGTAAAQTADSTTAIGVTKELLETRINESATSTSFDDAKTRLTELYRQSLGNLEATRAHKSTADAYAQSGTTAAGEAATLRQRLEKVGKDSSVKLQGVLAETPLPDIEQLLLKEKANLAAVETTLGELENKLVGQTDRPFAARQRITTARQQLESIVGDLKLSAPEGEPGEVTEARRWALQTQAQALNAEVSMLDQELLSQPVRVELLKARRDEAMRNTEQALARARLLDESVGRKRREEAEAAQAETEAAKREASDQHPLVQQVAAQNAELGEELRELAAALEGITADDDQVREQAKSIEDDFRRTRQRLEVAGVSETLGQVLQEKRRNLPKLRVFREQLEARERLIAGVGLRRIRHEEIRRELWDVPARAVKLSSNLGPALAEAVRGRLERTLQKQRELLDKVLSTIETHQRALNELDFIQRNLLQSAERFETFLAENLLWVSSTPPVNLAALRALPGEVAAAFSPRAWLALPAIFGIAALHTPLAAIATLIFALLMWKRHQLRATKESTAQFIGKASRDTYLPTVKAAGLTLLISAPWPLLFWTLGRLLQSSTASTEFSMVAGESLEWISLRLFILLAFRELCVEEGLAARHFRWPAERLALFRSALTQLITIFVPFVFVATLAAGLDPAVLGGTLSKIGFVGVLVGLTLFSHTLLHPSHGVWSTLRGGGQSNLLARLRHLWFAMATVIPLGLAGLALAGYAFTAMTLTSAVVRSLWVVLGFIVLHQMAERWLLIARRRLAFQAALERRRQARAAAEDVDEPAAAGYDGAAMEVEEPGVDFDSLNEQSRELLNTVVVVGVAVAVWHVWSAVMPAFGILDQVSLWHHTSVVNGEEKLLPVTLADVALAVLIAALTYIAAKRLPALIEIMLLQRFGIDSGSRYTITTLSGYAIAGTGIVLVFNAIGASWSQIQWLVAALGVGIGFGLQEIVANFISGLIILFERPIRVGDVVTVGETDGVVTRIRIRATTIRNWDMKELVVPNKEFITGRLLNWSLSDATTRVVIVVGIAYGSDVERALELLDEAGRENENVLDDPAPLATFEGFGDNALTMLLRCYLPSLENRLLTTTALHTAINRKFEDAGISISFPQRDIHLDTARPLDIRIHRGPAKPSNAAD